MEKTRNRPLTVLALFAAALVASLALAACGGSDDNGDTTAASGGGEGGDNASVVAKALEEVNSLTDFTTVADDTPKPTEAFDPGKHTAAIISCGQAGAGCRNYAQWSSDALKAMGWSVTPTFDGAFDPTKQAEGINQAVQQGVDGIVLVAVDYPQVKAALDNVERAEIPMVCVNCQSDGYAGIVDSGIMGADIGAAAAWYIINDTEGKGSAGTFRDKAFISAETRAEGFVETMEGNCPECTVFEEPFTVVSLAKPGPPEWLAVLNERPKGELDWFMSPYDALTPALATTVEQRNRDDIQLVGTDGDPAVVPLMEKANTPIQLEVVGPLHYMSWAAADQLARLVNGLEPWEGSERMPVRLVTPETLAEVEETGGEMPVGFDYQATFKELWGK